jgi:type 1 glutamine amidotransferase
VLRVAEGQLDMDAPGARIPAEGLPLAWSFSEGRGRVFYTSLGHFPGAWETPTYLQHVRGGLSWLLADGA